MKCNYFIKHSENRFQVEFHAICLSLIIKRSSLRDHGSSSDDGDEDDDDDDDDDDGASRTRRVSQSRGFNALIN